jgi:hypothetical protein
MDRAVPIFVLPISESYFPHKYLSNFGQRLVPFFHKTAEDMCISVNTKLHAVGTNTQLSVVNIAFA